MAYNPDSAPASDLDETPLFAVLGSELVSLEGHIERGVIGVLHEIAKARGVEVIEFGNPIQLVRSEEEVIIQ